MSNLWTFGDSFTAGHGCKYMPEGAFSTQNINNFYYKTYKNYISEDRFIWNQIVSNALSLTLKDVSANGSSTETIFDTVLKHISKISPNDLVIIQTSTTGRYDFPFLKEKTLMGYDSKKYRRDDGLFLSENSPYFFKTIFATNVSDEYSPEMEDVLQYTNGQENLKDTNLKLNKTKYDTIRNFFSEFISTNKYYERSIWRIIQLSILLKQMGITSYIINEDIWPMYIEKPHNLIEIHRRGMIGYVMDNKKTIYHNTNGSIIDYHPSYDGHSDIADFILNFINNENINIHNT